MGGLRCKTAVEIPSVPRGGYREICERVALHGGFIARLGCRRTARWADVLRAVSATAYKSTGEIPTAYGGDLAQDGGPTPARVAP